jgi:hypothetical protein
MGISIKAKPASDPPPYGVRVMLECDQRTDMFCRGWRMTKGWALRLRREPHAERPSLATP